LFSIFTDSIFAPWMWGTFFAFVVVALIVDLLVLGQKGSQKVSVKEALNWSLIWVALSFAFNGFLWWYLDGHVSREVANEKSMEFFTGYLIEKSLAVDNIFVFLMIFTYFAVPAEFQRRVLVLGVIGAIVLRAIMILLGAWLIARFHWILYVFGAFLFFTGVKMIWAAGKEMDLEANPVLKLMRKHIKMSDGFDGEKFFTWKNGVRYATPLFVVMMLIAVTDVIFAVDSIPAIFAITDDPFIVLTSNIFAILGLRAMYFLLADMAARFHLLSYGLAIVLIFIGIKMMLLDIFKIPVMVSLGVVAAILISTVIASLVIKPKDEAKS
jgi:tellurite resistance protein TerC